MQPVWDRLIRSHLCLVWGVSFYPRRARDRSLDFWKFWSGETISSLGSSFTQFALPLWSSSDRIGAEFGMASPFFSPYLLFGLVIGAWVDHLDRKRVMILAELGRKSYLRHSGALILG